MKFNISLRRLKDEISEYLLLEKWCRQKEIYQFFEQRILNFSEIHAKYYPRTQMNAVCPVYVIEYDKIPIGIIQYKKLTQVEQNEYNLCVDNAIEVDLFIGEENYRGKGIGEQSIKLFIEMIATIYPNYLIIMCPLINNTPAIKCYRKCEFEIKQTVKLKDTIGNLQNYLLMTKQI